LDLLVLYGGANSTGPLNDLWFYYTCMQK